MEITPKQKKKLEKIVRIVESGELGIAEHLLEIEEDFENKVDEVKQEFDKKVEEMKESVPDMKDVLEQVKGKDGYTPEKGKDYFDGEPGKDYILTEQDKKEIAKKIDVPVVEKVIEKTEVVREQPIEITKVEVKEVAVFDQEKVKEEIPKLGEPIRDALELLPEGEKLKQDAVEGLVEDIKQLKARPTTVVGGGRPLTVQQSGTTKAKNVNFLNFSGPTVTLGADGVTTVTAGDVTGPSSSTDNAIVRFDGTGGKTLQNSGVIISDVNALTAGNGTASLPTYSFTSDPDTGIYLTSSEDVGISIDGTQRLTFGTSTAVALLNITATTGTLGFNSDTYLTRDAANTLALRNGTTAQLFNIYDTFTNSTTYERMEIGVNPGGIGGNRFGIITTSQNGTAQPLHLGTGGSAEIHLRTADSSRWQVSSSGHFVATTDNSIDIGASGATRPRTAYIGTGISIGGATASDASLAVRGAGATSATKSVLVEDSAGTDIMALRNDGSVAFGAASASLTANAVYANVGFGADFSGTQIITNNFGNAITASVSGVGNEIRFAGTQEFQNAAGGNFTAASINTNTGNVIYGIKGISTVQSTGGRANTLTGGYFRATTNDATAGTFATVAGAVVSSATGNAGVTVTNLYGLRVEDMTNLGTATNTYGLHIGDVTSGTQTNQAYGLYISDTGARNYIGGSVGINETAPDYKLDVNGSFGFTPGTSVTPVDNGDVVIEATNNTTLTFKLKGSDGTIRTATLTLS
jgi:hypothetical protein